MELYIDTTEGPLQYPRDFKGHWTLLFYYSGDFLPVSATELMGLAELQSDFRQQDCTLLPISNDRIAVHLAFLESLDRHRKHPIRFPLGSGDLTDSLQLDPAKKYIWLLSPDGHPQAHFSYPHTIGANFTEVFRTLCALRSGKITPCGWVPGEAVLSPPPTLRWEIPIYMKSQEQAGKIATDWYLCYENSQELL